MSLGNWIRIQTTSTGTGNLSWSAVTGMPDITSQFAANQRFDYVILDSNDQPIERGLGYHDGSGNIVRELVMATWVSSVYTGANPSAASLAAGTKYIIVSAGAQSLMAAKPGQFQHNLRCYGDMNIGNAPGTLSITANVIYAFMFHATVDSDIDAVLFRVSTASSAGTFGRGAIYDVKADGSPGVQLALGAEVLTDTTGNKASTFTRFRPPPVFYVMVMFGSTPTLVSMGSGVIGAYCLGADSTMNPAPMWTKSTGVTYPTFPTTWTGLNGQASNAARPNVFVRCP